MSDSVYVFELKLLCGGYAYYSTYTRWIKFSDHNREVREASTASRDGIYKSLSLLGHPVRFLKNDRDYNDWLYLKGWALVPVDLAREIMPQWLTKKTCLTSAVGVFTDIEIVSASSLKRSYSNRKKKFILSRDGKQCLLCGQTDELTMQHVTPFSRGGETSSRNMVTLCNTCNQSIEAEPVYELYHMAGLHQGYDPSILNFQGITHRTLSKARDEAIILSSDLMNTRCEVW